MQKLMIACFAAALLLAVAMTAQAVAPAAAAAAPAAAGAAGAAGGSAGTAGAAGSGLFSGLVDKLAGALLGKFLKSKTDKPAKANPAKAKPDQVEDAANEADAESKEEDGDGKTELEKQGEKSRGAMKEVMELAKAVKDFVGHMAPEKLSEKSLKDVEDYLKPELEKRKRPTYEGIGPTSLKTRLEEMRSILPSAGDSDAVDSEPENRSDESAKEDERPSDADVLTGRRDKPLILLPAK